MVTFLLADTNGLKSVITDTARTTEEGEKFQSLKHTQSFNKRSPQHK